MHSCTIVVFLVVCFSAMTSLAMPTGGEYVVKANSKFTRVCSTDTPSQVIRHSHLQEFTRRCQELQASCQFIQFNWSNGHSTPISQCEIYDKFPGNFKRLASCNGYFSNSTDEILQTRKGRL